MKKYDVHVILGDKFHSVVIECTSFMMIDGAYVFYKDNGKAQISADYENEKLGWYPISLTIIEPHKENRIPQGSGQFR